MTSGNWISINLFVVFSIVFVCCSTVHYADEQLTPDGNETENTDDDECFGVQYNRSTFILQVNFNCSNILADVSTDTIQVEINKDEDDIISELRNLRLCTRKEILDCDQYLESREGECQVEFPRIYAGNYCLLFRGYKNTVPNSQISKCIVNVDGEPEPDVFAWNVEVNARVDSLKGEIKLDLILDQQDVNLFESYQLSIYETEPSDTECSKIDDQPILSRDFSGKVCRQTFSFPNLTQGSYCFLFEPDDERCNYVSQTDKTCTRHYHLQMLNGNVRMLVRAKNGTFNFTLVPIIGLFVLLLMVLLASYFGQSGSLPTAEKEEPYQRIGEHQSRTTGCPILLLYSEKSSSILPRVDHLKKFLTPHNVMDRADPRDESVDIEGVHWFANRLCDSRTKVVVVRCPNMERCEQTIVSGDREENEDLFCLYHLIEVMRLDPLSQYQRIFVVSFDDLPVGLNALFNLTPLRSYRLPGDLHHLLQDLG